ncbi:hypothetical protein EUX98_g6492 [Antrodiella citrinella]|uniref:Uncharacterized protein n=1 Tax=Antrodiella citrinella TaxID=2447956 RepID=A0A4S4MWC9_9APHY|nr:hypothetical protein EUX98_g6492 [Antrodiella citrinella]
MLSQNPQHFLSTVSTPLSTSSASAHKRPRGIWKGRRESPDPNILVSHDLDTDFEDDHPLDSYDDDLDDCHSTSSSSSSKRRRVSGAYTDLGNSASRPLSPDPSYSAFSGLYHAQRAQATMYVVKSRSTMIHSASTSNSTSDGRPKGPSTVDMEDWENLKELFSRAAELCEHDEIQEALPLLRAVLRECHRMLTIHPDPSVIYMDAQNVRGSRSPVEAVTPPEERLHRDWGQDAFDQAVRENHPRGVRRSRHHGELPTAFHATFGIALFLMGNIISQEPSLALPDEPSSPSTYWLGALDVFETGESLPCLIDGKVNSEISEDWRMAIAWGRTLVCLADEKISSALRVELKTESKSLSERQPTLQEAWAAVNSNAGSPFTLSEPTWTKDSPFYSIAANRPPVTRRMSLYSASAHDIMVLATDQFSRGIFHMPHPHYPSSHNPTHLNTGSLTGSLSPALYRHPSDLPMQSPDATDLTPSSTSSTSTSSTITSYFHPIPSSSHYHPHSHRDPRSHFSRPKELFTIASEVLGVSERLPSSAHREYWAVWADSVFNQMKMEADIDVWRGAVTRARGRCWLVVGSARAEEIEELMESGDMVVLNTRDAEEAREALTMAISFFERAKGSATATPDEDTEDISPLLTEALITLANLTPDENKREELYSRAQAEGGDEIVMELGIYPSASGSGPTPAQGVFDAMDTDGVPKDGDDDAMDET